MSYIEEKVTVFAPVELVWKVWADKFLKNDSVSGKKGQVVIDQKKGIKFNVLDYKEKESLTVVWYSFLIKLIFHHEVESKDAGSLITCKVSLKGFCSFIIKPLVAKKIRKYVQNSLQQFARNLNGI